MLLRKTQVTCVDYSLRILLLRIGFLDTFANSIRREQTKLPMVMNTPIFLYGSSVASESISFAIELQEYSWLAIDGLLA